MPTLIRDGKNHISYLVVSLGNIQFFGGIHTPQRSSFDLDVVPLVHQPGQG